MNRNNQPMHLQCVQLSAIVNSNINCKYVGSIGYYTYIHTFVAEGEAKIGI